MKQLKCLIFMVISIFVLSFPSVSACKPLFNPVEITPPDLNFNPCDVQISGNYVFIAGWLTGIHVFDISDFDNPRWVKTIKTDAEVASLAIKDGYLYAATAGLEIYDISSIDTIKKVTSLESEYFYKNVRIDGSNLFVNSPDEKLPLIVFDISTPENPQRIKEFEVPG